MLTHPSTADATRVPRARVLAIASVVVLGALLLGYWVWGDNHTTDDTRGVVRGTAIIRDCVLRGDFIGCGQSAEEIEAAGPLIKQDTAVGPFPLYQYLPAAVLLALNFSEKSAMEGLRALNILSFFGLVAILWITTRRTGNAPWGPLLALVMVTGPLLFYANSTFGEMLTAFLLALFAASVLLRWHPLVLVAMTWTAGITKETAVPFLIALGAVAIWARREAERPIRPYMAGLLAGGALTILTNSAFNVFRYGTPWNTDYFGGPAVTMWGDVAVVPWGQQAVQFGSLLFSPNGGLLFFWPSASLLLAAAGFFAFRSWRRHEAAVNWVPLAVVLLVFVGLTVGFAARVGPFGWHAWGPRYSIPWIPTLLVFCVALSPRNFAGVARSLTGSRLAIVTTSMLVWIAAIPHVGFLWNREVIGQLFSWSPMCPWYPPRFTGHMYFTCQNHLAWKADSILLNAAEGVFTWRGGLYALTLLAGCFGLVGLARHRSRPASAHSTA